MNDVARLPVRPPGEGPRDRLSMLALDLERLTEEHARLERAAKAGEKLARYVVRHARGEEMRRRASDALMAITGGADG